MTYRFARLRAAAVLGLVLVGGVLVAPAAEATGTYVPVSGAGSTLSQVALDQWRRDVAQYEMKVNYAGTGSVDGRAQFANGTVDYAMTETPYEITDGDVPGVSPARGHAYVPTVASGLAVMYNLRTSTGLLQGVRLTGDDVAGIFTGSITWWDAPSLVAHNPGLALPHLPVKPVVRADGTGESYQLTSWLHDNYPSQWSSLCVKAGRAASCGPTSHFPTTGTGFTAQSGALGVAGYTAQTANVGTITYSPYAYALETHYPVAKLLNGGGYYVAPTPTSVSVGLLKGASDPRSYPLSTYSSMIVPTSTGATFSTDKGYTLADFLYYALCDGQQAAAVLGSAPLPANLVASGLATAASIPGADPAPPLASCHNPTIGSDGDTLAANAPMPPACDAAGAVQCGTSAVVPARTSVVARASAGTVSYRGTSVLTARLTGGVVVGRSLVLERRVPGTAAWARVTSSPVDDAGTTTFTVRPVRTYDYRVRYTGAAASAASVSAAVSVKVRFAVSATRSRTTVAKGKKATIRGTVGPLTTSRVVYLEVYRSKKWVRVATVRTDKHGAYTAKVPTSKRGKHTYRVRKPADSAHLTGWSTGRAVRVT